MIEHYRSVCILVLPWLQLCFDNKQLEKRSKKLHELESMMFDPPETTDNEIDRRIAGSMLGLAIGGALGVHVEFQTHEYLVTHPITDFQKTVIHGSDDDQVIPSI